MLRPFEIPSDAITFSGGAATVSFANRTGPRTRAAIIGIDHNAANYRSALMTLLTSLRISGRQYIQGSGFPLGLLSPGGYPDPDATNDMQQAAGSPYFPGNALPTPDGQLVGGILLEGADTIEMSLTSVLSGSFELASVTLHCLEFPRDYWPRHETPETPEERRLAQLQQSVDELWARFSQGQGELLFDGRTATHDDAATLSARLESQVKMQHAAAPRRLEIRGLVTSTTTLEESVYRAGTLIVGAESADAGPQQKGPVGARQLTGHAHRRVNGLMMDLDPESVTFIDLAAGLNGTGGVLTWRFLTVFIGRSPEDIRLRAPQF